MNAIAWKLGAVVAGIGAVAPVTAWAQQQPDPNAYGYPYGAPMMGWGGGWGGMIVGPFVMIFGLALVIALAVLLVRWIGEPRPGAGSAESAQKPIDILKARFARGEIDKDEFEERRRILGE